MTTYHSPCKACSGSHHGPCAQQIELTVIQTLHVSLWLAIALWLIAIGIAGSMR